MIVPLIFSVLILTIDVVPVQSATASHFLVQNRTECDLKNDEKFELDMAKLLVIGENGRNYPETFKQLKPFCEESRRLTNRLDNYKNQCFRGTWKQFVSIFLYSNRNAAKQFCHKNNRQTKEIINLAGCVNGHRKRIGKCLNLLIDNMIGIKYVNEDKKKIPFLCCEYVKFTECFRTIFEEDPKCQPKLDATLDYMRSIMGNLINTGCGEYNEDTDKCQSLGKAPQKRSGDKMTHKTFVYPIFDVLDSIKVQN